MKLLDLPYLVRRKIYDEFSLSVFFLLSLCSKRMRMILQNSRRRLLRIGTSAISTTQKEYIYWGEEREEGISGIFILKTHKSFELHKYFCEWLPIKVGGTAACYSFGYHKGIPKLTFITKQEDIIESDCHTYFNKLFTIEDQLFHLSCGNSVEIIQSDTVKRTRIADCPIQESETMCFKSINEFFGKQPPQDLLIIDGKLKNSNPVVPNDKMNQAKNLILEHPDNNNQFFLMYFQGENLLIKKFSNEFRWNFYVDTFMRNWLGGKKQNLSSAIIMSSFDLTEKEEELLGGYERVNGAKRIRRHTQNKVFPYENEIKFHHNFTPDVFDCSGGYDFKRADGMIATMKITPEYFTFFVWR